MKFLIVSYGAFYKMRCAELVYMMSFGFYTHVLAGMIYGKKGSARSKNQSSAASF